MSTTLSIENPLKGADSSDNNNLDVGRLDVLGVAQEFGNAELMRLQYKMRARARAAKLEAADVRELGRLNYRFLIQRRTGGIDIKNGKRVPWVDRRFHVTNEALKQNKKTPRRRSNQRIRLRRIQYRRSSWNFPF
jgi:hypothetical protein